MTEPLSDVRWRWQQAIKEPTSGLTSAQRWTAVALSLHMNPDGKNCFPGLELLARETGYVKSTVVDAINALDALGWIDRKRGGGRSKGGGGRSTVYTPHFPANCPTVGQNGAPQLSDQRSPTVRPAPNQLSDHRTRVVQREDQGTVARARDPEQPQDFDQEARLGRDRGAEARPPLTKSEIQGSEFAQLLPGKLRDDVLERAPE